MINFLQMITYCLSINFYIVPLILINSIESTCFFLTLSILIPLILQMKISDICMGADDLQIMFGIRYQ